MPDLDLRFSRPIEPPPTGPLSRPVLVPNKLGDLIVFHDRQTFYAYLTDGQPAWHIKARIGFSGFAVSEDTLFVQDGFVLCQYDVTAQQDRAVDLPDNAISFRDDTPLGWAHRRGDSVATLEASLAALCRPGTAPPTCSAPVLRNDDNRIHVLRSDGTVFSPLLNLSAKSVVTTPTDYVPDQLVLYSEPGSSSKPRLCWVSGGKLAIMDADELEIPSEGLEAWRWNSVQRSADQAALPFGSAPGARGFISSLAANGGGAAVSAAGGTAITVFDPQAARWSFHLLEPTGFPLFNAAGSMMVADAASGAAASHRNANLPAGLAVTYPPPGAQERAGVWTDPDGAAVDILAAPWLANEASSRVAYAIATVGSKPSFCKFGVPETSGDFVLRWWKAVKEAYETAQPILAGEIVYALTDETQAAINTGAFSADQMKAASSPLWPAVRAIPWDKFDATPPKYVRCSADGNIATIVDRSFRWHDVGWDRFGEPDRIVPNLPLLGPILVSAGATQYLILANPYDIYGFTLAGTLAWRIPARVLFYGWVVVEHSLVVSEAGLLSRYDLRTLPTNGDAVLYPDQFLSLASEETFYFADRLHDGFPQPESSDGRPMPIVGWQAFDWFVGHWTVDDHSNLQTEDLVPHYDDVSRTVTVPLGALGDARGSVKSHSVNAAGGLMTPGSYGSELRGHFECALAANPVREPWRPPAVPGNLSRAIDDLCFRRRNVLLGGAGLASELYMQLKVRYARLHGLLAKGAEAPPVNMSDGVPVSIVGAPLLNQIMYETPSIYCCLVKGQQNVFIKFRLPD